MATSLYASTYERSGSAPCPRPSRALRGRWPGWRGCFLAHKEKDEGQYTEEHHAKDPGDVIIGQHCCLPIHQAISHHQRLVLGRDWIACLLRQASGKGGVIANVGTAQGADVGAQVFAMEPGEPLKQSRHQGIAHITANAPG